MALTSVGDEVKNLKTTAATCSKKQNTPCSSLGLGLDFGFASDNNSTTRCFSVQVNEKFIDDDVYHEDDVDSKIMLPKSYKRTRDLKIKKEMSSTTTSTTTAVGSSSRDRPRSNLGQGLPTPLLDAGHCSTEVTTTTTTTKTTKSATKNILNKKSSQNKCLREFFCHRSLKFKPSLSTPSPPPPPTTPSTPLLSTSHQQRRFGLFLCFIFLFFCLLQTTQSFNVDDSTAVGRSAHEPKFGERLLPLSRRKSTVSAAAATSTTTNNQKNLNKNNYFLSNAVATNVVAGGGAAELYTLDDNVDDDDDVVVVSENEINQSNKRLRQAKQLNRREDTNIINVINNNNNNNNLQQQSHLASSSSATAAVVAPLIASSSSSVSVSSSNHSKADRLIEMSTEFFVVPTPKSPTYSSSSKTATKTRVISSSSSDNVAPRSVLVVAPPSSSSSSPTTKFISTNHTSSTSNHATHPTIVASTYPNSASTTANFTGGLRKEPWVVPVLVLAALTMLMMGAFEVFVLFKAWRTSPSRRHLFLGQMLLLGLFACAGLGAVITAQPSLLSCGAIRFGVGVSYALVFAALLVKCVFLISLNGGVYLPAPYQGLLLLFAVLIQVAIGAQWLLTQPPEIYTLNVPIVGSGLLASTVASSTLITTSTSTISAAASSSTLFGATTTLFHPANADLYTRVTATGTVLIPLCKTQFSELLFSLIYIIFLVVFVAVLAIKSRGIRDNYREATYIGLAIGGAIPIWLGWTLCGLAVAERHKDACIAFGLVATSATVFLVMFMPKGRQLAAMGKEGLYVEDREEQFSSLSRAGSGYSPSFFHFKPIKYGVMSGGGGGGGGGGGLQHSSANAGIGTSGGKHCSNGGDRVALVTAAPPSYTRMYHYFPAPSLPPTHHHHHHHPFCFYPQPPPPPLPMPAPPPLPLPPPPPLQQAQQIPPPTISPTTIAQHLVAQQHQHHHLLQHHHQQHQQATPLPLPPPPNKAQIKSSTKITKTTKTTKTAQLTQLVTPPTLKQLGNSLATMTQAHLAQTLRYPGLFIRPDESNLYTTLEPTLSSNPNVYFQRGGAVHPGMMY